GKIMISRINSLIAQKKDFGLESTLSGRSLMLTIQDARKMGYSITLLFVCLENPNLAWQRVQSRVKDGGHFVPEKDVRRRYKSGIHNFFYRYMKEVDFWMIIDNSSSMPYLVAEGEGDYCDIKNTEMWDKLRKNL
ncbi:MAG: zeta toxin family protein, partial [Bacteroidetes bacterium]|nr:zeta toxin family protein [Bacteroidota bacterium]